MFFNELSNLRIVPSNPFLKTYLMGLMDLSLQTLMLEKLFPKDEFWDKLLYFEVSHL